MGIQKSDLLGVTMAVIHVATHIYFASMKWLSSGNGPYSCEIRVA